MVQHILYTITSLLYTALSTYILIQNGLNVTQNNTFKSEKSEYINLLYIKHLQTCIPQCAKYFSEKYTAVRKVFLCKIYRNAQSI